MYRLAILLAAAGGILYPQCEPSGPVRHILDEAAGLREQPGLSKAERETRQKAILEAGIERHPHDYYLLRRLIFNPEDGKLAAAQAAREKNPGRPVYELIYAEALVGRDTPEAIWRLEALARSHPELPRAHLEIALLSQWGKFKDPKRAEAALKAYLAACPAPLDAGVLFAAGNAGEQLAPVAAAVRARLEKESSPLLISLWQALWSTEFRAYPPGEHAALRDRIRQDLARLQERSEAGQLRWLEVLRAGFRNAGDAAAAERLADQILERYPETENAQSIVRDRWNKQHPYPRNADRAQLEAWSRASLPVWREWHARWPHDSLILDRIFNALVNLPETFPEEIARAGQELMAAYRRNPNWYGSPPVEFRVATEYAKRRVNLNQVQPLVQEGYRATMKRRDQNLADDRIPQQMRDILAEATLSLEIERARVLLAYYGAIKQSEKAAAVESQLAALSPSKPYGKMLLLQARAEAAELLGRRLDALLMFRAALQARTSAPSAGARDPLADSFARLWTELGGTDAGKALLDEKKQPREAAERRWERPAKPLPAFSLSDLEGKTWKLAELKGKTVLVNVWATWCGPCRTEHPEFQKLYEKIRSRPDTVVLSFNVDSDPGAVAPYMKENRYTFPVLLAGKFVTDHLEVAAIPQNWFIDASGKHQWTQVGFGGEPDWEASMLAKLDEVAKSAAP